MKKKVSSSNSSSSATKPTTNDTTNDYRASTDTTTTATALPPRHQGGMLPGYFSIKGELESDDFALATFVFRKIGREELPALDDNRTVLSWEPGSGLVLDDPVTTMENGYSPIGVAVYLVENLRCRLGLQERQEALGWLDAMAYTPAELEQCAVSQGKSDDEGNNSQLATLFLQHIPTAAWNELPSKTWLQDTVWRLHLSEACFSENLPSGPNQYKRAIAAFAILAKIKPHLIGEMLLQANPAEWAYAKGKEVLE